MNWLNKIADEIEERHPSGEVLVSSGVSPSGAYHLGTLREVLTAEAIYRVLKKRGRKARHIHVSDDLDVFRKVPADVPKDFKKYLGMPLCDMPSPDGKSGTYADFFLKDLLEASDPLNLDMEVIRAHEKYRSGFYVPAIEKALEHLESIRKILENVSGHKLGEEWSPIQINEDGYLKKRTFLGIDKKTKTLTYLDKDAKEKKVSYAKGDVKLDWRIDWPARWWLLGVNAEPFGRDHATKGGSYDTGYALVEQVFDAPAPLPIPYEFINRTGDTKKMSKSSGNTLTAAELLRVLPPEIIWFFTVRYAPAKTLYFDTGDTLIKLFDEFAELLDKSHKTQEERDLLEFCLTGIKESTVSSVPFSHLVASYQASLKDPIKTLDVIRRTEHRQKVDKQEETIRRELAYIENWLNKWAPDNIKFDLVEEINLKNFDKKQLEFASELAEKVEKAPEDADGEWFHKVIYDAKGKLQPKEAFQTLYQLLIGKDSGPRAGWFLSILPRDWLIQRLRLKE